MSSILRMCYFPSNCLGLFCGLLPVTAMLVTYSGAPVEN